MNTATTSIQSTRLSCLDQIELEDPSYGDFKLNLFPVTWNGKYICLPTGFDIANWEEAVNEIFSHIPVLEEGLNDHYVTIDSKFFAVDETLRREGLHIDGNFCADPNFKNATWGGVKTWSDTSIDPVSLNIDVPWVSPYGTQVPIGTYVSEELGGLICLSSYQGCYACHGSYTGQIGDGGSCDDLDLSTCQLVNLKEHMLYAMSSNTPHASTVIPKGNRRTFIRVTLNHNFPNKNIFSS